MSEQVENEQPSSLRLVRLVRRDRERRMARFYTMYLAQTIFGGWDLVREWGRIGSPGTLRITPFETLGESAHALRRIENQKRKRGYLYNIPAPEREPLSGGQSE